MTAHLGFFSTAALVAALAAGLPGAPLMASPATGQATAAAATTTAAEVVDQVQKFYAAIGQVTAQFQQTVHNAQFGTDKTSSGMVWLMKPGKMRWDYLEKRDGKTLVKKSFISNGTTLYDVEPANKQVIKKSLQNDVMPVAVSFLYGKGDLKTEFDAALDPGAGYGGKGDLVLELTPKQPSAQYKHLYLVVDPTPGPDQYRVKESIIIDTSNNVNHFRFYAPDFRSKLKPSLFEFDVRSVPSYQMVDADAPIKPPGRP